MLFVCPPPPKMLHKQNLQFLLGVKMAPRENNAYAKFLGNKQRALWYVMVFFGVVTCILAYDLIECRVFFFFFYQIVFFRGGTGENGFREWHNRGKHSINQVKLRGVAHVALTIIRCLLTFCFFALFFNFTLFFIHLLAVFQARMRTSLSHNLHKIQEFTLFFMLVIILKNCNVLMRILQSLKSKNKTL